MNDQEQVDAFLFALCCERRLSSTAYAVDAIRKKLESHRDMSFEAIAGVAAFNYQDMSLPTPRQHILRMAHLFCPDQLDTLPEKLDGCSESKHLEVLSALQKRYGLVVGNDVAVSLDPVQCLLHRNRMLVAENETLRQQLGQQSQASSSLTLQHEIVERLYECTATIEALNNENCDLRRQIEEQATRSVGFTSSKTKSEAAGESAWMLRCQALQKRLEDLVEQQIDERTAHSAAILALRAECSRSRDLLSEQTSRANAFAQAVAELEAQHHTEGSNVKFDVQLYTKDANVQTSWTGNAGVVDESVECSRERCKEARQQVGALTTRLAAAAKLLMKSK